ncbi:MAG: type II toxin-antitoxin system HipA family toxin [Burkholderiales bacterium]|nr:type II toxin-antitoxin system HipA family toxin [Burkholderiales bacterium]
MAHDIGVWLFDQPVGSLSLAGGRLSFQYRPDWLSQPNAVALSQSLPLGPDPFNDHQCRAFFAGLLPEGNLRRLIAQQCQVSSQNDFALLNAIGGECAGAITFVPDGLPISTANQTGIQWLDEPQLIALLNELPRRPMLAGRDGMRLSLAGAQDKLPVVFDGERIGLPKGGQPSTHILKPAIASVQDSVINEGFCLALAQAMGMPTAQAQIFQVSDRQVLLVARYDRRVGTDGQPVRIHQEDFCQALGTVPEMKYQNEGGPDLKACFDLLRKASRPSAPQVLRLLDAVIFNALVGNHDAHAKNFSLLCATGRAPTLAPLYDMLSTAVYDHLTPKMAMKLGSKYKFTEVQTRHWDQFAQASGLSKAQTKKRVLSMAQDLPVTARQLQALLPFLGQLVVGKIIALIEQRSALTARRLLEGNDDLKE